MGRTIAADEMSVVVAGNRVWLTRRTLEVLMVLAERPGPGLSMQEES